MTGSTAAGGCVAGRRRRGASGFTLLEVMVAMVILGLIVTSSFGALRLGERSWETGVARAGDNETLRTVTRLLQRQFSEALRVTWTENAVTRTAFSGTHTEVRFIAPAPWHLGASGLFEYHLATETGPDGTRRLQLRYRLHDPDARDFGSDDADMKQVLLVDGLESAAFTYYGCPKKEDEPQWHRQWNSESDNLPRLVRVSLVSRDARQLWPDLLLTLHTEQLR